MTRRLERVNDLLQQINTLNTDITRAKVAGADGTGSENVQSGLIDELSTLMNIQVSQRANGGVIVRSTEGLSLAGDGAAVISYQKSSTATGFLQCIQANGGDIPVALNISSGELKGLLDLHNTELPNLSDQLGEFVTRASEELNRASNAASSVPAPSSLTGRNTGLDEATALDHFTGKTTIALTDSSGVIQREVEIDFDLGTMTVNGAAGPSFTNTDFIFQLNAALGGQGTASFSNGALSLSANAGNGVVVADDPTTPSSKIGKGFSHFFGLNDIVQTKSFSPYETGLTASDPHGFTPGDVITLRLTDTDGGRIRDVNISVPAGATMQDLMDTLNVRNGGVGLYGTFSLDAKGAMNFTSYPGSTVSLSVASDDTERGMGGPSITQLFGVGPTERSTRGERFVVNPPMDQAPARLPFAKLNLSAAPGVIALAIGDGRGALALAKAGDTMADFAAVGGA